MLERGSYAFNLTRFLVWFVAKLSCNRLPLCGQQVAQLDVNNDLTFHLGCLSLVSKNEVREVLTCCEGCKNDVAMCQSVSYFSSTLHRMGH